MVHNLPTLSYDLKVWGRKASYIDGGYGIVLEVDDAFAYYKGFIVFPDYGVAWVIDISPDGRFNLINEISIGNSYNKPEEPIFFDISHHRPVTIDGEYLGSANFEVKVEVRGGTHLLFYDSEYDIGNNPGRVGFISFSIRNDGFEARFNNFDLTAYKHLSVVE